VKRALAALCFAATAAASAEPKLHVVRRGETLATIAQAELGDIALWPALYRANRDRIKDPTRIYPGQRLTIPEPGSEGAMPIEEAAPEARPEDPASEDGA
jgi:nucleoid-associated protein YgaU